MQSSFFLGKFSSFTSIGLLLAFYRKIPYRRYWWWWRSSAFGISEKRMVARVHTETFQDVEQYDVSFPATCPY